jgi:hypothetical protein
MGYIIKKRLASEKRRLLVGVESLLFETGHRILFLLERSLWLVSFLDVNLLAF